MAFRYITHIGSADWLSPTVPGDRLISVEPTTFPAYARLRYIPDPTDDGQLESDTVLPEDHLSDLDQVQRALGVLASFTGTPDRCLFCVWDGWGTLPPAVEAGPMVELPHRRYALVSGSLDDLAAWETFPGTSGMPPAFVWPADRSWLFESDVDPHWAAVGGTVDARAVLLADPLLDVVTADPAVRPPYFHH